MAIMKERELKMIAIESDKEADPAAFENSIRIIASLLVREYQRRHRLSANFRPTSQPAAAQAADDSSSPKPRLLDVDGLSKYLSLPKSTIYTWVSLRRFPEKSIVRLGRSLRFDLQVIDEWIKSQSAK